ncbi:MAG TPA: phosphate ABC transporter ATP-binding protein PstB [Abditibacteriaceae bacterium]|jgi:phosphate transport system ATP-binding protein
MKATFDTKTKEDNTRVAQTIMNDLQTTTPNTTQAETPATPRRIDTSAMTGLDHADPIAAISKMQATNLNLWYGPKQALKGITSKTAANCITALIGPSGCGKSTYLRCLNRMNDLIENCRIEGDVTLEGQNIYARGVDVVELRQRIGMVFQKPNPFPMSIFDNIAYGPRLHGINKKSELQDIVEESLNGSALWNEVKDDLKKSALALSGGQQQRLCIARSLATKPDVLLMDEPCSALDPISTLKIEELMRELKDQYTIVIVTHNMQQAARVSDFTGFFLMGELVEMDASSKIFTDPGDKRTEDYITGRFG